MPFDVAEAPFTIVTVPTPPQYPDDGLNRENIRKVRDVIARLSRARFDMQAWARDTDGDHFAEPDQLLHQCGTSGCIGGWTEALIDGDAADSLGLNYSQSRALFYPEDKPLPGGLNPYEATPAQAVAVLDHLIATGEVSWAVAERVS
jgi:hypothetical protein